MKILKQLSAVCLGSLLMLGCSEQTKQETKEALDEAGDAAHSAADDAKANIKKAGQKTGQALENAGDKIEQKFSDGEESPPADATETQP